VDHPTSYSYAKSERHLTLASDLEIMAEFEFTGCRNMGVFCSPIGKCGIKNHRAFVVGQDNCLLYDATTVSSISRASLLCHSDNFVFLSHFPHCDGTFQAFYKPERLICTDEDGICCRHYANFLYYPQNTKLWHMAIARLNEPGP